MHKIKPFLISLVACISVFSCTRDKELNLKNTIYKLGYKTDSFSTGPLLNSGFVLKLHDTIPSLFLTAHHVVAGTGKDGEFYKWFELKEKVKNAWIWSMHDSSYQIALRDNLPIADAETLKLDLAAFYLPDDKIPYLIPSNRAAQPGDTVQLFSKIIYNDVATLLNPAVVIYAADSLMVYELLHFNMARIMGGTSGSAIINSQGDVVASSYAGFTIPNQLIKDDLATKFPLINKLTVSDGKSYGVAVPIPLIQTSIFQALKMNH